MPPHLHYVEPYAGGLAVLLARDPEGVSEVVNDLDSELSNFWQVLQDEEQFAWFRRQVEALSFSEITYHVAERGLNKLAAELPPWARAACFFVVCRMSLAGRKSGFTLLSRRRTRRGMNGEVSAWLTAVEGLPAVHERLKRVVVLNRPALDVIRSQDEPTTLFYCDPPYPHETRSARKVYGRFEMSQTDHRELLDVLRQVRGKVMLSTYPSALYDGALAGWNLHTFDVPNNAAGGKKKGRETEVLWCNF
jgi:DNA adenine methylase